MNKFLTRLITPALLAVAFSALPSGANAQMLDGPVLEMAQAADCLRPRAAQEATVSGQLLPLQQVYAQYGLKRQDVVDSKVCRRNGELYYVLSVYVNGVANTMWINASTGMS